MSSEGIVLFDPLWRKQLLPLAFTRSVADFRIGIQTIRQKWTCLTGFEPFVLTVPYLQPKYRFSSKPGMLYINSAILPGQDFLKEIDRLPVGKSLTGPGGELLAARLTEGVADLGAFYEMAKALPSLNTSMAPDIIRYCWDIFSFNGNEIKQDIAIMGLKPSPDRLSPTNSIIGQENVYVEEGVQAEFTVINASLGPVYLGKGSEVMEGTVIRGPFALGEFAQVKMASKIYGDTTIGPYCKVGGEISNSVLFGYSNKAHDGFLGNSVIGEWCNLGADTNNSNLKNNYGQVAAYNYQTGAMADTGLQFCGLIMGDHSKCGINTMFNTGTVAGVSANIYGSGFPPKHIPSFSWGGASGLEEYDIEKALNVVQRVMVRKQMELGDIDRKILQHIFSITAGERNAILKD